MNVLRKDTMVDQHPNYHFVSFCCETFGEFRNIPVFFIQKEKLYSSGKNTRLIVRKLGIVINLVFAS